jgi:hypothetical protein
MMVNQYQKWTMWETLAAMKLPSWGGDGKFLALDGRSPWSFLRFDEPLAGRL